VNRIITDLAVIDVTGQGLLRELAPGVSAEAVRELTQAPLEAAAAIGTIGA